MKSKKHILLLTPGFPKNETDSVCIPPLQALVRELHVRYGNQLQITVVTFQYPFEKGFYYWNGIACWSAGGKNLRFPGKLATWTRVARFIFRLHKKTPVDIVHSFWLHDCALIGQWVAKLCGAIHLAHAMGQDVLNDNPYIRFLNRKHLKVIANSPFTSKMLKQVYNLSAYRVLPFGIHPEDFMAIPESSRKFDLLAVGSLTDVKNHELFVEIFAALKKMFPFLTGNIIGDGPLAGKLREQIHRYGLDDSLHMEGAQSRSVVLLRMSESKIFLHTAAFESAAYVFLEALYSGMKVVSFQTGFLPQVPGAFPCSDEASMIKVLQKLLNEHQEYTRAHVPVIAETADAVFKIYTEKQQ